VGFGPTPTKPLKHDSGWGKLSKNKKRRGGKERMATENKTLGVRRSWLQKKRERIVEDHPGERYE